MVWRVSPVFFRGSLSDCGLPFRQPPVSSLSLLAGPGQGSLVLKIAAEVAEVTHLVKSFTLAQSRGQWAMHPMGEIVAMVERTNCDEPRGRIGKE